MNTIAKKQMLKNAAGAAGLIAGYLLFLRPKHLTWGASRCEAEEYLPGDELLRDAENTATHAITIKGSPTDVWPWIAQIGQGKAGFYSYTLLENMAGCEVKNSYELHPEWQRVAVGDPVRFHPQCSAAHIASLVEGEHMVVAADLTGPNAVTWSFTVRDLGHGWTRLIIRLRARSHCGFGRVADLLIVEPAHFLMERKMLLTIKRLAEDRAERRLAV